MPSSTGMVKHSVAHVSNSMCTVMRKKQGQCCKYTNTHANLDVCGSMKEQPASVSAGFNKWQLQGFAALALLHSCSIKCLLSLFTRRHRCTQRLRCGRAICSCLFPDIEDVCMQCMLQCKSCAKLQKTSHDELHRCQMLHTMQHQDHRLVSGPRSTACRGASCACWEGNKHTHGLSVRCQSQLALIVTHKHTHQGYKMPRR